MTGHTTARQVRRKTLIEECLTFTLKALRRLGGLRNGATSTITWALPGGGTFRVEFCCHLDADPPQLHLNCTVTDRDDRRQTSYQERLTLDADSCGLGGSQWYIQCPRCDRRVRQLHVPPGQQRFACRHCYDLVYLDKRGQRLVVSWQGQQTDWVAA